MMRATFTIIAATGNGKLCERQEGLFTGYRRLSVKHAIQISALACAIVVIAAPTIHAAQAQASIKTEMLKDWSDLKATLVKIANEMPADKYGLKPTPAQQSFGERVVHIAQVGNRLLGSVG